MKKENRLFVSLYSEDDFRGITIPMELKDVVEYLWLETFDVIDSIFESYDDYRDYEVEMSSYAKDGSAGTTDVDTIEDLKKVFSYNNNAIKKIEEYEN